jgi:hypothetical protein|uniref:Uncharacterized protein n=1 Tax=Picea sitchensis TaxID=3332 RepID=A0A6B9XZ91_PICSI|nr:hypothetical protein Q903MT_gene6813 [Picea sitchensis]
MAVKNLSAGAVQQSKLKFPGSPLKVVLAVKNQSKKAVPTIPQQIQEKQAGRFTPSKGRYCGWIDWCVGGLAPSSISKKGQSVPCQRGSYLMY